LSYKRPGRLLFDHHSRLDSLACNRSLCSLQKGGGGKTLGVLEDGIWPVILITRFWTEGRARRQKGLRSPSIHKVANTSLMSRRGEPVYHPPNDLGKTQRKTDRRYIRSSWHKIATVACKGWGKDICTAWGGASERAAIHGEDVAHNRSQRPRRTTHLDRMRKDHPSSYDYRRVRLGPGSVQRCRETVKGSFFDN
jgi:hypothetical protein